MKSKLGLIFSGVYVLLCAYLVVTQGLFGESFIAIILGLPWSLLLSYFEYGNASGALLASLLLAPMAINAWILYCVGSWLGRRGA